MNDEHRLAGRTSGLSGRRAGSVPRSPPNSSREAPEWRYRRGAMMNSTPSPPAE